VPLLGAERADIPFAGAAGTRRRAAL
jgi:hypothetical protein